MPTIVDSKLHTNHTLELSRAIDRGSLFQVRQMIKTLPTAGVAHLLESSPPKTRSVLWQLIDKESEGEVIQYLNEDLQSEICLLYTSPSPRDGLLSRMPSSA